MRVLELPWEKGGWGWAPEFEASTEMFLSTHLDKAKVYGKPTFEEVEPQFASAKASPSVPGLKK